MQNKTKIQAYRDTDNTVIGPVITLSLPINLMYSSKTEFEANLDDTLAVGIGLSYRH